jgi:hypothetical protein
MLSVEYVFGLEIQSARLLFPASRRDTKQSPLEPLENNYDVAAFLFRGHR